MKSWVRISASLSLTAADVWAAVAWAWGSRWEILEQIGPPEYAAFIALLTIGLVTLNWSWIKRLWSWINRLRPSVRFRELADELDTVVRETPKDRFHTTGPTLLENRVLLARKLRRLKIETPPNPSYGVYWLSYLEKLRLYARLGNIDAARTLWAKEQQQYVPPHWDKVRHERVDEPQYCPTDWKWWDE